MIPTLLPAYGRDYKSKASILADLNDDKDFVMSDLMRGYINRTQLIENGFTDIVIRYGNYRKVTSAKLSKAGVFK